MHVSNPPSLTRRAAARAAFLSLLLITWFATCATATATTSVTINSTDDASEIDAYSARVGAMVTAVGETATWVIEYGPTLSYGQSSAVQTVAINTFEHSIFTIVGLKPNTKYYFHCKATGKTTGVVNGPSKTFTTISPTSVAVSTAPTVGSKHLFESGDSVNLNITADAGSYPLTYQWKRNGVAYGAASQADYLYLHPLQAVQGGTWTCLVSNPISSATSPGTLITVAAVTKFTSKPVIEGGTFSASVTLAPANAAATYHWYTSGNATLTGIGIVGGQGTNKLTVTGATAAADDTYQCDVTVGADTLTLDTGHLVIGLKPVVDPIPAQTFRVGEFAIINVEYENFPTSGTVTGLPAGLTYSFVNGGITGKAVAPTPIDQPIAVTVTGSNANGKGAPLVFALTINPLDPGVIGSFTGTIAHDGDAKGLGGKITLSTTAAGAATGSLTLGTAVYPINTKLSSSSGATGASVIIPSLHSGANPVLNINVNLDGDAMSGTVAGPAGTANISGMRNPFNPFNQVAIPGSFNCAFTPQSAQLADPTYPHGTSFGTLTITSLGAVTFSGRMADGAAVTASSSLGGDGSIPLFAALYSGNGSILGQPKVSSKTVSGTLSWSKNAAAGGRLYGPGFASHDLTCVGARYLKPTAAFGQLFLGLAAGANNAKLAFTDATLTSPVSLTITVNPLSVPLAIPAGSNPNAITVTLNTTTGVANGTFKVTDPNPISVGKTVTRSGTYYGLAVPGTPFQALGFFTLPDLPIVLAPDIGKNPMRSGIAVMSGP